MWPGQDIVGDDRATSREDATGLYSGPVGDPHILEDSQASRFGRMS